MEARVSFRFSSKGTQCVNLWHISAEDFELEYDDSNFYIRDYSDVGHLPSGPVTIMKKAGDQCLIHCEFDLIWFNLFLNGHRGCQLLL